MILLPSKHTGRRSQNVERPMPLSSADFLCDELARRTVRAFTLYFELYAFARHGASVFHGHLVSVELTDHLERYGVAIDLAVGNLGVAAASGDGTGECAAIGLQVNGSGHRAVATLHFIGPFASDVGSESRERQGTGKQY